LTELDPDSPEFQAREIRKFARVLGIAAAVLALLPVLLGWLGTPEGARYLPFHLSLDDHMVYAAWMRQAMDGQFLFDNRFTTDSQPGLTVHVYFFLLGLVAKLFGIPLTLTLARVGFSFLAVRLLGEFLVKIGLKSFTGKFALVMSCEPIRTARLFLLSVGILSSCAATPKWKSKAAVILSIPFAC